VAVRSRRAYYSHILPSLPIKWAPADYVAGRASGPRRRRRPRRLRGGNERAYLGNTPITTGGIYRRDRRPGRPGSAGLSHVMDNHRAGDSVRVTIYRGKRKMDVNVSGEAGEGVVRSVL